MVRIACLLAVFMFVMTLGVPQASAGSGQGFGYYFQWFRDADGDGIPNGLDDDWTRPADGTGYKLKHGNGNTGGTTSALNTDGNVLRKQYRFRYDPAGDGQRLQIHKRLRDGN